MKKILMICNLFFLAILFVGCKSTEACQECDECSKCEEREENSQEKSDVLIDLNNINNVEEIKKTGFNEDENMTEYTIIFSDATKQKVYVPKNLNIVSMKKTNSNETTNFYEIMLSDGTKIMFSSSNEKTAYEIAVENGFVGSEEEWLEAIKNINKVSAYEAFIAANPEYNKTEEEWLKDIESGLVFYKKEYSIKFNTNIDISVDDIVVLSGDKVIMPNIKAPDGYTLEGWYVNDKKWDFEIPVFSDMILSAKWEKIGIERIEISNYKSELTIGETMNITANIYPVEALGDLEWASSDSSILSVDDKGNVTAKCVGSATITVKSKENDEVFSSVIVKVIASEDDIKPTNITILGPERVVLGYNAKYEINVKPINASDKVLWESLNPEVAIIDEDGNLTPLNTGVVRIRAISVIDKEIKSNLFKITIIKEMVYQNVNMEGYEILIMAPENEINLYDPFLDTYTNPDKLFKQKAWLETEKEYNCTISVIPYQNSILEGDSYVQDIIDNAAKGAVASDISIIASRYLEKLVDTAYDVTDYYNEYEINGISSILKEAGSHKGKIYIVSTGISQTQTYVDLGLYYKIDWIKENDVADPATMFNSGMWNYTGFKNWCLEVQSKLDLENNEYAIGGHPYYYWLGMTTAAGIKVSDKQAYTLNIDSNESETIANFIYSLVESGCVDTNVTSLDSSVIMTAGYMKAVCEDTDSKYGYVPFPYPDELDKNNTYALSNDFNVLMINNGRESYYPNGITAMDICFVVKKMYLKTIEYYEESEGFEKDKIIKDELSKYIENDESIDAIKWFNEDRVILDAIKVFDGRVKIDKLKEACINTLFKGYDYKEEFNKVKESNFES